MHFLLNFLGPPRLFIEQKQNIDDGDECHENVVCTLSLVDENEETKTLKEEQEQKICAVDLAQDRLSNDDHVAKEVVGLLVLPVLWQQKLDVFARYPGGPGISVAT